MLLKRKVPRKPSMRAECVCTVNKRVICPKMVIESESELYWHVCYHLQYCESVYNNYSTHILNNG